MHHSPALTAAYAVAASLSLRDQLALMKALASGLNALSPHLTDRLDDVLDRLVIDEADMRAEDEPDIGARSDPYFTAPVPGKNGGIWL